MKGVKGEIEALGTELKGSKGNPVIHLVQDTGKKISENVWDVQETILIGIVLTIVVVFLFLANGRSTIITALALPNSLLGAFVIMSLAGFTINVVSLLALTLAVGLLIDDAIVVRENIFRHLEMGKQPEEAARVGTQEVTLAVIATTAVVIAVFAPVGFMSGIMGQFLKQFGLTICFAMAISLFDALTIAPMLSTYFAEARHAREKQESLWGRTVGRVLESFSGFQDRLAKGYEKLLRLVLRRPLATLALSLAVFVACTATVRQIPIVFIPDQDTGELSVALEMPPGTNLDAMTRIALKADELARKHPGVHLTTLTVGGRNNESNIASMYIALKPGKERTIPTPEFRELLRKEFAEDALVGRATPRIKNGSGDGGPDSGLQLNLMGNDQRKLEEYSLKLAALMKADPAFQHVDLSYRPGKPEFQLFVKPAAAPIYGMNTRLMGEEIRAQVDGTVPAKFREEGREYDIRVRLKPEQRNLKENFDKILIPNINNSLVRLSDVAQGKPATAAASIDRLSRSRYVQVSGDVADGVGTNQAIEKVDKYLKELKLPPEIRAVYADSTENYLDMIISFAIAIGLGVVFIFLVLASLYESFITPFTIMLALPLAICGAFAAIFISNESLSLFAMLGIVMLLGVACKNSILLVDAARQLMGKGMSRVDALVEAGKIRLRPILMTSVALIAGTVPIAVGLNEASAQRVSMGYGIMGGLVSSTLLTLIVVPAAFIYIDRFRVWSGGMMKRIFSPKQQDSN